MKTRFENLGEVREQLVRMGREFVARAAGIELARLDELERGDVVPTLDELERLAALYGVEADTLEDEPIQLSFGDGVACLTRTAEYREIGDATRAKIIGAANAARDVVQLEKLLGATTSRWERFKQEVPRLKRSVKAPAFRQGARYASQLRASLGLGNEPIVSMRQMVRERFPSLVVLHARMGAQGPAGLAFADATRGPTIVLNLQGKNENACVRRVSLAHELCHLIVDWNQREPLATISGYLDDSTFEMEQRANAFAIRLICPESVLSTLDTDDRDGLLAKLSAYGLPYAAVRLYLRNQANKDLGGTPSAKDLGSLDYGRWAAAEAEAELGCFPLAEVPPERCTDIARMAAEAFSRGLLTRSAFASYLGVSPLVEVERVLNFYDLDAPKDEDA